MQKVKTMQRSKVLIAFIILALGAFVAVWIYNGLKEVSISKKVSLVKRLYLDLYEEAIKSGNFPHDLSKIAEFPAFVASGRPTRTAFQSSIDSSSVLYYPENGNVLLYQHSENMWTLKESDLDKVLMIWTIDEGVIECSVRGAVVFSHQIDIDGISPK